MLSLFFLNGQTLFAQRLKIDSLKRVLSSLGDNARADCLNTLSLVYTYLDTDTASFYAARAYSNSTELHYVHGLISSLNNRAHIAGLAMHNYPLQERISMQTLKAYGSCLDETALSDTWLNLALALFCQSYFERASAACASLLQYSQKAGDMKLWGEAHALKGCISLETGNYEKAFEYLNKSLEFFKMAHDSYNTAIVLSKLGDLYYLAGDQKTALHLYFESLRYPKGVSLLWNPLVDLGDTYYLPGRYDTASHNASESYIQSIKWLTIRSDYATMPGICKAEMHIAAGEYDKALLILVPELEVYRMANDQNQVMRTLLAMANACKGKRNYDRALYFTQTLLERAGKHHAKQYLKEGYLLMYSLYDKQLKTDSAYLYYRRYTDMKDTVAIEEFAKKLAMYKAATEAEKRQAQIELLKNEKLVGQQQLQLSRQQLKGESFQKNALIAGIIALALFGLIIFRNFILRQKNEASRHEILTNELRLEKLETERSKSELLQRTAELEMQALRAQMNPHFIFNSLNSINRYILQNKKEEASEFLVKFSRLIRLILQNSQHALVALDSELEALQIYLELEAERFNHHFKYAIATDPGLDTELIKVPPLIIQPYAENAIWHGLMHKEEEGNLQIDLFSDGENLCCRIADDGVGRQKATEIKSKTASAHKSMGMQITASRIAMMLPRGRPLPEIRTVDIVLPDGRIGGTEVLISIPLYYD